MCKRTNMIPSFAVERKKKGRKEKKVDEQTRCDGGRDHRSNGAGSRRYRRACAYTTKHCDPLLTKGKTTAVSRILLLASEAGDGRWRRRRGSCCSDQTATREGEKRVLLAGENSRETDSLWRRWAKGEGTARACGCRRKKQKRESAAVGLSRRKKTPGRRIEKGRQTADRKRSNIGGPTAALERGNKKTI